MERMQRVDFYELCFPTGEIIAEIGIYGDAVNSQLEADKLAQRFGAVAHFDRTGIVYTE